MMQMIFGGLSEMIFFHVFSDRNITVAQFMYE